MHQNNHWTEANTVGLIILGFLLFLVIGFSCSPLAEEIDNTHTDFDTKCESLAESIENNSWYQKINQFMDDEIRKGSNWYGVEYIEPWR